MQRLAEVGWMLACLPDIASDLSVFHRIPVEEVHRMPAARFFMLAMRLPAYTGAVQARMAKLAAKKTASPAATPHTAPAAATTDRTGVRRVAPHPGSSWSFATAGGEP